MDASAGKQEIIDLYTTVATTYGRVGPDFFGYFGRRLVERVGVAPGARVLDVATGRGAILFPALDRVGAAGRVVGIDLASGMVRATAADVTRTRVTNVSLLVMDAERLAFQDGSVDVVTCGFAIFLFPHLTETLAEFSRVLRGGGRLGITLAIRGDERWRWYNDLLVAYHEAFGIPLAPPSSNGLRDPMELVARLRKAGFIVVDTAVEDAEFTCADADTWWESKWTHGARYPLERMPPEILNRFTEEVFARLASLAGPDGFHERWSVACIVAAKPGTEGGVPKVG